MNVWIKHFIFRYYLLFVIAAVIAATVFLYRSPKGKDEVTLYVTIIGGLISAFYFVQKQQLEELELFKELFTEFNGRYDKLNDRLTRIATVDPASSLTADEINTLNDYFNLCGEEFLFYQRGYIYPEVWKAWYNGMKFYLQFKKIKDHWEKEEKTDSYYGLNFNR